jgi:hypothetical protein
MDDSRPPAETQCGVALRAQQQHALTRPIPDNLIRVHIQQ